MAYPQTFRHVSKQAPLNISIREAYDQPMILSLRRGRPQDARPAGENGLTSPAVAKIPQPAASSAGNRDNCAYQWICA
jgi:hypothetical protein